jgi:SAM-dependent methyltransferase
MPDSYVTERPAPRSPFDELSRSYDSTFSETTLGRLLRERVWRRLDRAFGPGARVLDVGCGTGEDALHLASRGVRVLATDASDEMVGVASRKVERAALQKVVHLRTVPAEGLTEALAGEAPFDGVLSNFGVLNCVADLATVARQLEALTRPGARVFLVVMGPVVPWEWGWFLLRGSPGKAFRRLRPGGVAWRGLRVRYPTVGAVRRAFAKRFESARPRALGALLPPGYAEAWALRHPRLIERLAALEERVEAAPPLPWLADHYLLELVRR